MNKWDIHKGMLSIQAIGTEVEEILFKNAPDCIERDIYGAPIYGKYPPKVIEQYKKGLHYVRMADIYARWFESMYAENYSTPEQALARLKEEIRMFNALTKANQTE